MPMPQNDPDALLDGELELKKRSRRRLVGAIALALLAIVVLPMVMDREPRPPTQDIQVKIPSQDAGGFTSRILPAKPASTAEAKVETKPEAKPETEPVSKAEPKKAPEVKPEPKTAAAKPVKAPEKPAAKPAAAAAAKNAATKAEEARAKAALNGATISDRWVVQLGAYQEASNVKHLLAKLKELGLPSFTEHFESSKGSRTRVRAGPFDTREAAEKARIRIKTIGVGGTVAQQ
jgi:DedD protein